MKPAQVFKGDLKIDQKVSPVTHPDQKGTDEMCTGKEVKSRSLSVCV